MRNRFASASGLRLTNPVIDLRSTMLDLRLLALFGITCCLMWGCQSGAGGDETCASGPGFEDASCEVLEQVGVLSPLDGSTHFQGELIIYRGSAPINVAKEVKVRSPAGQFVPIRYTPSTTASNQYIGTPSDAYPPGEYAVDLDEGDNADFRSISFRTFPNDPPRILSAEVDVTQEAQNGAGDLRRLTLVFSEPMNINPQQIVLFINGVERAPQDIVASQRTPHNPTLRIQYTSPEAQDAIVVLIENTLLSSTTRRALDTNIVPEGIVIENIVIENNEDTARSLRMTYKGATQPEAPEPMDPILGVK